MNIDYYPLYYDQPNIICGNLVYKPQLIEGEDIFELVLKPDDWEQPTGKKFLLEAPRQELMGEFTFRIIVESDLVQLEPPFTFDINIEIVPCKVH